MPVAFFGVRPVCCSFRMLAANPVPHPPHNTPSPPPAAIHSNDKKDWTAILASPHHAVQASVVVTFVLWLKFVASCLWLSITKGKAGVQAPSDGSGNPVAALAADRAQRIVNNDLENIVWGLIIMWASWFTVYVSNKGVPRRNNAMKAHMAFTALFLVGRLAHTATYATALSRPRSVAWLVGLLATFGMALNVRAAGVFACARVGAQGGGCGVLLGGAHARSFLPPLDCFHRRCGLVVQGVIATGSMVQQYTYNNHLSIYWDKTYERSASPPTTTTHTYTHSSAHPPAP
jgi:hypothetical protein